MTACCCSSSFSLLLLAFAVSIAFCGGRRSFSLGSFFFRSRDEFSWRESQKGVDFGSSRHHGGLRTIFSSFPPPGTLLLFIPHIILTVFLLDHDDDELTFFLSLPLHELTSSSSSSRWTSSSFHHLFLLDLHLLHRSPLVSWPQTPQVIVNGLKNHEQRDPPSPSRNGDNEHARRASSVCLLRRKSAQRWKKKGKRKRKHKNRTRARTP